MQNSSRKRIGKNLQTRFIQFILPHAMLNTWICGQLDFQKQQEQQQTMPFSFIYEFIKIWSST